MRVEGGHGIGTRPLPYEVTQHPGIGQAAEVDRRARLTSPALGRREADAGLGQTDIDPR